MKPQAEFKVVGSPPTMAQPGVQLLSEPLDTDWMVNCYVRAGSVERLEVVSRHSAAVPSGIRNAVLRRAPVALSRIKRRMEAAILSEQEAIEATPTTRGRPSRSRNFYKRIRRRCLELQGEGTRDYAASIAREEGANRVTVSTWIRRANALFKSDTTRVVRTGMLQHTGHAPTLLIDKPRTARASAPQRTASKRRQA